MKYYSETLNKVFDTEDELKTAEEEQEKKYAVQLKKKEERAERAKEVEKAYKEYRKLLNAFIKDYGYYHQTLRDDDGLSIFDIMFNHWPF